MAGPRQDWRLARLGLVHRVGVESRSDHRLRKTNPKDDAQPKDVPIGLLTRDGFIADFRQLIGSVTNQERFAVKAELFQPRTHSTIRQTI
jgi:hypothetical protein